MEYKEGDWVEVIYTGQHCHGFKGDRMILKITHFKENGWVDYEGNFNKITPPDSRRWISFITEDGEPVLFSAYKIDYIIGKVDEETYYEIY